MGVLFENSIVCHVFYAIVSILDGWALVVWLFGLFVLFLVCLPWLPRRLRGGLSLEMFFSVLLFGFLHDRSLWALVVRVVLNGFFGEFDPGSGRTLAACLTHASRTVKGPAFVGPG